MPINNKSTPLGTRPPMRLRLQLFPRPQAGECAERRGPGPGCFFQTGVFNTRYKAVSPRIGGWGALVIAFLTLTMSANAQRLAIRHARILPIQGAVIADGTILIENGKIRALGANVAVPPNTPTLDVQGATVMPGLVDANAHFGLRDTNEQAAEVTPQIRITGQIAPRSPDFQHALAYGVTSACLTPESANVVGGECAVVKTSGRTLEQMLLRENVGVRAALGNDTAAGNGAFFRAGAGSLNSIFLRRPNSRMASVWELRKSLDEASKYPALAAVRNGKQPLRVIAHAENDIRAAVTIADEFKLPRLVLDEGCEAYKVADLLAGHRVAVVLGPFADPQANGPDSASPVLNTPGILAEKGIPIAFGSNSGDPGPLLQWAALAVKYGLEPDVALRAITLNAAELCGVADRVGSLEVGKDADLLILRGDPLELTTQLEKVIVNGQVVYRAE
jgi:imidazolonepropionase-like amidohydrolase